MLTLNESINVNLHARFKLAKYLLKIKILKGARAWRHACLCMRACVRACVRAYVRACTRACVVRVYTLPDAVLWFIYEKGHSLQHETT